MIALVLGGARSGKSAVAERWAADLAGAGAVTYVATGIAVDGDMAARIAEHRARRPAGWQTVEAGADLLGTLRRCEGTVLVDALGTWVASLPDMTPDGAGLCEALARHADDAIVVSEEVGLGVHPATDAGRQFRDVLGTLNQQVAAIADEVILVVAGRALPLGVPVTVCRVCAANGDQNGGGA